MVQPCFYHLRNISRIRPFLSAKNLETIIYIFITSQLDYFNSLLFGISKKSFSCLQLIQNSAARILTQSRKRSHFTDPGFPSLATHCFRIDFKNFIDYLQSPERLYPKLPIRSLITPCPALWDHHFLLFQAPDWYIKGIEAFQSGLLTLSYLLNHC